MDWIAALIWVLVIVIFQFVWEMWSRYSQLVQRFCEPKPVQVDMKEMKEELLEFVNQVRVPTEPEFVKPKSTVPPPDDCSQDARFQQFKEFQHREMKTDTNLDAQLKKDDKLESQRTAIEYSFPSREQFNSWSSAPAPKDDIWNFSFNLPPSNAPCSPPQELDSGYQAYAI
jgi:hypothetical protein